MKKASFILVFLFGLIGGTYCQTSTYDSFINKGLEYYYSGNYQNALLEFQKAHTFDSTKVDAYYYSGVALASECYNSGTLCNEAIKMLSIAINIDPNYRKTFYNRGICFLRIGIFELLS